MTHCLRRMIANDEVGFFFKTCLMLAIIKGELSNARKKKNRGEDSTFNAFGRVKKKVLLV